MLASDRSMQKCQDIGNRSLYLLRDKKNLMPDLGFASKAFTLCGRGTMSSWNGMHILIKMHYAFLRKRGKHLFIFKLPTVEVWKFGNVS